MHVYIYIYCNSRKCIDTIDGRNPANRLRLVVYPSTGFFTSQVVQDFFHQHYVYVNIHVHINTFCIDIDSISPRFISFYPGGDISFFGSFHIPAWWNIIFRMLPRDMVPEPSREDEKKNPSEKPCFFRPFIYRGPNVTPFTTIIPEPIFLDPRSLKKVVDVLETERFFHYGRVIRPYNTHWSMWKNQFVKCAGY